MSKRKRTADHENTDRWLLTYADLLTLLLGFFVIMYSMSHIDAKRFGKMAEGLQGVFRGGDAVLHHDSDTPDLGSGVLKVGDLKLLQARVKHFSESIGKDRINLAGSGDQASAAGQNNQGLAVEEMITTEIDERGLVIHILESALFESGKAELKPKAERMLDQLNEELTNLPNHLRVEGHTDNRPISTPRYPSNWELSTARATAVVRYLTEKHGFPAGRISALGYGEYRPLVPNDSPANQAKNRRVDIVVLTDKLSELEPHAAPNREDSAQAQKDVQEAKEVFSTAD